MKNEEWRGKGAQGQIANVASHLVLELRGKVLLDPGGSEKFPL